MDLNLFDDRSDDDFWDGTFYKNTCSFATELGEDLIDWLEPERHQSILDVGCGTGELTAKLSRRSSFVVGLDASQNMLREARENFPRIPFLRADIRQFSTATSFDAVFSNAALHWVQESNRAIESVRDILREEGWFVAEMGAAGNIRTIRKVLHERLSQAGYDPSERDPWYFPEPSEYLNQLEDHGLAVDESVVFDRPTEMHGDQGMRLWFRMFAEPFFRDMEESRQRSLINQMVDDLRDSLYINGEWVLDYRRLRFRAIRE